MAVAEERTIVTKGKSYGHHDEGILDTAAYPGMHIQLAADGHYDPSPQTTAELVKRPFKILKEDSYQGKTVNDQYAVGALGFYYEPLPGDEILALVKAGENIVVADVLIQEGGGTGLFVEAAGTEVAYRLEAQMSSGGALAAAGLIKCKVVR